MFTLFCGGMLYGKCHHFGILLYQVRVEAESMGFTITSNNSMTENTVTHFSQYFNSTPDLIIYHKKELLARPGSRVLASSSWWWWFETKDCLTTHKGLYEFVRMSFGSYATHMNIPGRYAVSVNRISGEIVLCTLMTYCLSYFWRISWAFRASIWPYEKSQPSFPV